MSNIRTIQIRQKEKSWQIISNDDLDQTKSIWSGDNGNIILLLISRDCTNNR